MERLQKIIAERGFCSRRKAEEYILQGLVWVNGKKVKELGTKVSEKDEIIINHTLLEGKEKKEYYLFYKPSKVISSVKDEKQRKTVVDFIPTKKRIYPIGRLDYDTTGLLLLTNDGELSHYLTHPKNNIEKVYVAKINGILTPQEIQTLKKGIEVEKRMIFPTKIKQKITSSSHAMVTIGITEGRNHIVKKIFAQMGYRVLTLKRESYAFLTLDGLKVGEYRPLTFKEVKKLYAQKNCFK